MRKYANMLLVLGIMAANPAFSQAQGLLSGLSLSKTNQQQTNQQKAQQVADAMKRAKLNGYDLGVEVRGDTVKLIGKVRDVKHRELAARAAKSVPGIKRVLNGLNYVPQGGIQQTAGRYVDSAVRPATFYESAESGSRVEQVHFQKPGKRTSTKKSTKQTYRNRRPVTSRPAVKKPDHQIHVVQPKPLSVPSPPPAPPMEVPNTPMEAFAPPMEVPTPKIVSVKPAPVAEPVIAPVTALAPLVSPKAAVPSGPSNQEVAQNIANSMAEIGLVGYDVEIRYEDGTAVLNGDVATVQQLQAAGIAASRVTGVYDVDNRLKIQGPVAQTSYSPQGAYGPQGYPSQVMPASMGMAPMSMGAGMQGGAPTSIAGAGNYSNPNLPSHAWPAYAAYPNSAAIQYPKQYSASAWPYIGPFYPYPQVPLGWREVSLQWDDGHWQLDFEKKQKAWYWLWNPTNWH